MIAELILTALLCQVRVPPPAPVAEPPAITISQSMELIKKVEALQKQIEDLKKMPCPHCNKSADEPVGKVVLGTPIKMFKMKDRWGREYQNESYERLVYDIDLINRYGTADLTKIQKSPPIVIPQTTNNFAGSFCNIKSGD